MSNIHIKTEISGDRQSVTVNAHTPHEIDTLNGAVCNRTVRASCLTDCIVVGLSEHRLVPARDCGVFSNETYGDIAMFLTLDVLLSAKLLKIQGSF